MEKVNNPFKTLLMQFEAESRFMLDSANDNDYNYLANKYNTIRNILEELNNHYKFCQSIDNTNELIKTINRFIKTKILDYLTLNPNEFSNIKNEFDQFVNIRCPDIYKLDYDSKVIYHKNAYTTEEVKVYVQHSKTMYELKPTKIDTPKRIYLLNKHCITPLYFTDCIIPESNIGLFTLQSKVILPVSKYIGIDDEFYFINPDNGKYKILSEFYDIVTYYDENMKTKDGHLKYNVMNYRKTK